MQSAGNQGLYRQEFEHDACGVGMVARLSGKADHEIVQNALTILKRLMHRGATGNDPETGDGAGLLMKIPHEFFRARVPELQIPAKFAVGVLFGGVGREADIEAAVAAEGAKVLAWRDVPVDPGAIGRDARKTLPAIRQFFVDCTDERKLYVIRRMIEKSVPGAYIPSLSAKTIVYKGLLLATQIERFYPDLAEADFVSPFAIVHQRYSTNTFPSWELAHPFRMLAHNGEINALKGNLAAVSAREKMLASDLFGEDIKKLLPVVPPGQSDSAALDNMFELLVAAGRDAPHAMMMLIPQAWGSKYHMGRDIRAFYEYHSALMEPWDGPAAVAFTDGESLGATLDRNGLRPARWTLTKDGLFVLASETGVLDIPREKVERKGRLRPGAILWLDLARHRLMEDREVKTYYARRRPYRRWVEENRIPITGLFNEIVPSVPREDESQTGSALSGKEVFGWSLEDEERILRPMAETGHEPVGAMGNDAALACLSTKRRSIFDYFHQLFAQVTNPPIDPIREELVMSIMTYIGNKANILEETAKHAHLVKLTRPVLTDDELKRLGNVPDFPLVRIGAFRRADEPLKAALDRIADEALRAVQSGARIIVLSDKNVISQDSQNPSPNEQNQGTCHFVDSPQDAVNPVKYGCVPVESLLAVVAVNKALAQAGVRPSTGIVAETGFVREVHHFAVLLGFGATAVNPYLALETVARIGASDPVKATSNYIKAVCRGLMKTMSKMGISTLRSYRSARIFEAVGLGPKLMEEYFSGAVSPVGGKEIEEFGVRNAECGVVGGQYSLRKGGEEHLWTPQRLADFREAVRKGDLALFRRYTDGIDSASRVTLRSQLKFRDVPEAARLAVDAVESVDSIVKRFVGGAMSLGSLSPEAHETIALALNGLGTMSNSGEGGENPERFGTDRNSAIKQVASGRFGVTIEYLASAKDLQIKLAQGAKPGEGGQLPAHKVDEFVAKLRHAKPGTTLISPPPHHDIYSIEDLSQLIYDLKCANPRARVSVKLVSEAGVGTIAAGVAKAHADVVVVSGFDGGTGAAPLSSMKHAGIPWEPGLAEAHQTLLKNNLRGRVRLQVDGQLRTGRDIVVAAMLGADEFAFGTSMLVALGCVQCRNCNLNCCPVGIATQKSNLREKFAGRPEHLQNYFRFLAEEVREVLASLGLKSLAEVRGRADLLEGANGAFDFTGLLAGTPLFSRRDAEYSEAQSLCDSASSASLRENNDALETIAEYDRRELIPFLAEGRISRKIANSDRSVGAALAGHVAQMAERPHLVVDFAGTAGQSFAAFLAKGLEFNLDGDANDYVGKSLSGGVVSVRGDVGNVIAYGATSGGVFVGGTAGERFGIRNSGATLVCEGVGDHGCEYMTGGAVLVLGPTGVNFAAGMTGGVAYVYDRSGELDLNCNLDSVDLFPVVEGSADEAALLELLKEHATRTDSEKAKRVLANWPDERHWFAVVQPRRES